VARVSIKIEQKEFSLQFAVRPNITGDPAAGYAIEGLSVDPRLVTVIGPLDVLQPIDAIGTAEISVSDARDDVIRTVALEVPDGAPVEGAPTARITIDIAPLQGEQSFTVTPTFLNVGSGLTVVPASDVVVTLSGSQPQLQAIDPATISVTVDLDRLGEGLHVVPVEVTAPSGTSVKRVEPGELGIAITLQ
jgi:YbbR domain-containing protein